MRSLARIALIALAVGVGLPGCAVPYAYVQAPPAYVQATVGAPVYAYPGYGYGYYAYPRPYAYYPYRYYQPAPYVYSRSPYYYGGYGPSFGASIRFPGYRPGIAVAPGFYHGGHRR